LSYAAAESLRRKKGRCLHPNSIAQLSAAAARSLQE